MKAITSLTALVMGATLATMAWAQADATTETTESEPVEVAANETVMPSGHDVAAFEMTDGRWRNDEGIPTFKVEDGVVDFATFNGFRRYHAECHVCHGPDGEGSTYAPALKDSVLRMDYYDFMQVVASGRQGTNSVMPAFGTNKNVWCYIDDIYTYLVAHGTGTIGRGRPAERADKSEEYTAQEDACMSM
ncbi:c-type cytochrome, methanol metabolism-related [Paracoccus sp. T5]|uniref:c-type cytochrome, methanol metabolism-related n=1 Tax=Paracoccus sp. T5 TaxID=3402161 RepID=UPI003AE6E6CD